ncbi:MAG: hypothetical protein ACP5RP_03970 [Candidatus Micrarchaeia archaeon]
MTKIKRCQLERIIQGLKAYSELVNLRKSITRASIGFRNFYRHINPDKSVGGFVEETAEVGPAAFTELQTLVIDHAKLLGSAKLLGHAMVGGWSIVSGNAVIGENAVVTDNAEVYGNAKIYGYAMVYGDATVKDNALIRGKARVHGNAIISGNADIYNREIKEYSAVNGNTIYKIKK